MKTAERPKNPESWTPPPLWAPLSGHLMMGALKVPVMVLLLWLATAGEVILSKSWLPGDTQAEIDEKWRRTKQLTHETFDEDVQEIRRRARQRAMDNYDKRT